MLAGAVTDHEFVALPEGASVPKLCAPPPVNPDGATRLPLTAKASRSPLFVAVQLTVKVALFATLAGALQFIESDGPVAVTNEVAETASA